MQGPMTAVMSLRTAPSRSMAATVASTTPQGAAPAGMGGPDDSGLAVGEEYRRAVGRDDAEGDSGNVRNHGVGDRRVALAQALDDHRLRRVGLMDGRQRHGRLVDHLHRPPRLMITRCRSSREPRPQFSDP